LRQAVDLVHAVIECREFDLKSILAHARQLVADWEPGSTTRAIMDAAEKRGIPYTRDGAGSRLQLGYGKHLRYVQAAMTDKTNAIAVELAQDKDETIQRLRRHGIPVPVGEVVRSLEEANQAPAAAGRALVGGACGATSFRVAAGRACTDKGPTTLQTFIPDAVGAAKIWTHLGSSFSLGVILDAANRRLPHA